MLMDDCWLMDSNCWLMNNECWSVDDNTHNGCCCFDNFDVNMGCQRDDNLMHACMKIGQMEDSKGQTDGMV